MRRFLVRRAVAAFGLAAMVAGALLLVWLVDEPYQLYPWNWTFLWWWLAEPVSLPRWSLLLVGVFAGTAGAAIRDYLVERRRRRASH